MVHLRMFCQSGQRASNNALLSDKFSAALQIYRRARRSSQGNPIGFSPHTIFTMPSVSHITCKSDGTASPAGLGAIIVALISFIPAIFYAYIDAYYLSEPDPKFGREGAFHLSSFIIFWVTVCNLAAFISTVWLYYRFHLPRKAWRIIIHCTIGTILSLAWFMSGIPFRFLDLLPNARISNNGVPEIILIVALFSIAPFIATTVFHYALTRIHKQQQDEQD